MSAPLLKIRALLAFFIIALVLSGITAFPLLHEPNLLCLLLGLTHSQPSHSGLAWWLLRVRDALRDTYSRYPFIAYGTDWLAFGHLVIALFFIGPFKHRPSFPRRPRAHVETGRNAPSSSGTSSPFSSRSARMRSASASTFLDASSLDAP